MLCFNVLINGKRFTTAGIAGLGVLSIILTRVSRHWDSTRKRPMVTLGVSGLQNDVSFRWLQQRLRAGDVVTIELQDQDSADEPQRTSPEQAARDLPRHLREDLKHVERHRAELIDKLKKLESGGSRPAK